MLDELELQWTPIQYTWRLNERHYGALQGRPKRQCSEEFGVKQVQKWRRGITYPPPPWDAMQRSSTVDRRYAGVDVPESESLADCTARLRPFLQDELKPAMRAAMAVAEAAEGAREERAGNVESQSSESTSQTSDEPRRDRNGRLMMEENAMSASYHSSGEQVGGPPGMPAFVIASSENLIRALVSELEGLDEEDVPLLDIPYATPLVYEFDEGLRSLPSPLAIAPLRHGYYLGNSDRIREVQRDIRESLVCETDGAASDEPCEVDVFDNDSCFVLDDENGDVKWVCD